MNIFIQTLVFAGLLILSCVANAQKWYQVEVIIFSQHDKFGDEGSKAKLKLGYPANLIELSAQPGLEELADNNTFNLLDKKARRLAPDAYSLNSTGVYRVLYHQVWEQPGLRPGLAPWIAVQGGREIADHHQLEGSIRLYLSDYLHLDSNLWLIETGQSVDPVVAISPIESGMVMNRYRTTDQLPEQPKFEPGANSQLATQTTQSISRSVLINKIDVLEESVRLQLDKLHYIDHPRMGLLVRVSRRKIATTNTD
jgi:hypothetical protein